MPKYMMTLSSSGDGSMTVLYGLTPAGADALTEPSSTSAGADPTPSFSKLGPPMPMDAPRSSR